MLVVLAAVAEGIVSIATVHDSFGCLASRAGRFNQIIRRLLGRRGELLRWWLWLQLTCERVLALC